ncbi:MAG: response regulator FixJ [Pseudomonadota bacterium]
MEAEPTIFIVDDDAAVRDSLQALLEAAGLRVEAYDSGARFLDGYRPPRHGCALIDLRMPGMDGLAVQRALAGRDPGLPVIVVTGHGDVPLAVSAMKAGAVDFIEKPFTEKAILDSVRHALDRATRARRAAADAARAAERIAALTPRERQVLDQLVLGRPNKQIAFELEISPRTVEIHRARVMEKMQARSLSEIVRLALAAGLGKAP